MKDINDITDYIILKLYGAGEDYELSNLKLQKLLYYNQAWHLAFYSKPLFNGKFEAWVHGPVNREIYNRFRDSKYLYSLITPEDVKNTNPGHSLGDDERLHIDTILNSFALFSAMELEMMTHREKPWIEARGGINEFARCETEINEKSMEEYYKGLLPTNG